MFECQSSLPLTSMSAVLTSYQIPLIDGEIIQFDKQNPLGRARHGAVFRGFTGGRNVAVKVIPEQVSPMDFVEAVKSLNDLDHPNIAEIIGASDPNAEITCLVSEYYHFGNISDYLDAYPHADRPKLVQQVASGMAHLHSKSNIIHGNLRPSNILIDDQGNARVSESNLAKLNPSKNPDAHRYHSPEAWKGTLSKPADVFAFAMTSLEVFTGTMPWGMLSEKHVYQLIVYENARPDRPEPDIEAQVGLTTDLWNIIENAWHPEARVRPSFNIISRLLAKINSDRPIASQGVDSQLASMTITSPHGTETQLGRQPTSSDADQSVPPPYEVTAAPPNLMAPSMSPRASTSSRDDWAEANLYPQTSPKQASSSLPSRAGSTSAASHRSSLGDASSIRSSQDPHKSTQASRLANSFRMSNAQPQPLSAPIPGLGSSDTSSVWEHNSVSDRRRTLNDARSSWNGQPNISRLKTIQSVHQPRNAVLLAGALQTEVESTRNTDAIDGCLAQIQRLALQSDKDAEKLVTAGVIPTLIRLLKIRTSDLDGLEVVLVTLGLLSYDSISANTVFRTNTTTTLIELFKSSISDTVSTLAIWCLNRICRTADVAQGLIKQNFARLLIDLGLAPRTSPSIARIACWTLGMLVHNDNLADSLAEMGAIPEVVNYLNRVSTTGEASSICAGLYAVGRISRSIKLAKALNKAVCVPSLAQHLHSSTDPDILMWTARAVGCLMRPNSGDMAKALLDAGIARGLARLPSVLPTDEVEPLGSFAFAVQRFSCAEWGSGTRKALVEAGVVDALLAGLRTVADEPHPQIHIEMALAVSFLGDVGGGAIRKEIVNAGGIVILKRVGANGNPEVAKACSMAVTSITGNLWARNAASAKTAMSHNWSGGCPDYHAPCPVPFVEAGSE